jgi:hypothetical protein
MAHSDKEKSAVSKPHFFLSTIPLLMVGMKLLLLLT